jgi:hypothetical protein
MAMSNTIRLEDHALLGLLAPRATAARHESGTGGVLEDLTDALVRLGGALKVLVGANLLANLLTLLTRQQIAYMQHTIFFNRLKSIRHKERSRL